MPTDARIFIIGAGGHAKVVMDALLADPALAGATSFADDNPSLQGSQLLGRPVQGPVTAVVQSGDRFHVAIGSHNARRILHERLCGIGAQPLSIVHPGARVSPHASLGQGVFVAACAVVGPLARVDDGTIVNHGAVVDHDAVVGAFSHVAPHATLGGAVRLGQSVLVGAGATVLPGVSVGDRAVIGAGAVVIANVPTGAVHVGVPAGQMREKRI